MPIESVCFTPSATYEEALQRAAALWGILPEYEDVMGVRHRTSAETKQAILAALGAPTQSREALDQAVERRLLEEWSRPVAPIVVITAGTQEIPVQLPEEMAAGWIAVLIVEEHGWVHRRRVPADRCPQIARAELGGRRWLRVAAPLPEGLPLGYHTLRISILAAGRRLTSRAQLIVCPSSVYCPARLDGEQRAAGLAINLYSLRSARNWGCGDFTDLETLTAWAAERLGVSFLGLNPLHAIANRQPFNTSPYLPASVYYKNPIYLDVERLEDFQRSARARRWFQRPEVQAELEALRQAELVEYERVYALKLRALKLAFLEFLKQDYRADSPRARAFRAWREAEGRWLELFAIYSALDEWLRARNPEVWVWPQWPAAYQDPESPAVRDFAKKHWRSVLFYQYVQWQLDLQLASAHRQALARGLRIGLYHDLALATDRCGADFWAYRACYVPRCRVGAPPDDFSPNGQDWAFPPMDFRRFPQQAYRLFIQSIRQNCRHGGALRIDHVMRLFRLYWIPEGRSPSEGAYVEQPYQDLLPILALESVRNRTIVIGEDLGTVTPEIRARLESWGLLGYRIPYFEKHLDGRFRRPEHYTEQALVSSTTHDLPTLAGFWLGRDIEARLRAGLIEEESARRQRAARAQDKQRLLELLFELGLLPEWFPRRAELAPDWSGELHNAMVGLVCLARCRLMALTIEDLFKETEQQNLPASTWQHPNWRRKMRFALEELDVAPFTRACSEMFRHWVERSGRRLLGASPACYGEA